MYTCFTDRILVNIILKAYAFICVCIFFWYCTFQQTLLHKEYYSNMVLLVRCEKRSATEFFPVPFSKMEEDNKNMHSNKNTILNKH